jgi:chromate transporter
MRPLQAQTMMLLSIFRCFFLLGCLSFGGPMAHIAIFRQEFVVKRHWLSAESFGHLLAMCQLLPGPASSQLGFAIGLQRAGLPGAIAAFSGFTLPSFVLMVLLAQAQTSLSHVPLLQDLGHWLKLFAVCVVADAVLSLSRQFCYLPRHRLIALLTALLLILYPSNSLQLVLLAGWAGIGYLQAIPKPPEPGRDTVTPGASGSARLLLWPLLLFIVLFGMTLVVTKGSTWLSLFALHYQAGSLVFGGGHVVLPLLQQAVVSQLSADQFLNGYAAAQIMPGPMFTLASYLGAEMYPANPWSGALVATLGIFLPGFLLVLAMLPAWQRLLTQPRLLAAVAAVNAGVVGLLLACLYHPLLTSAIRQPIDIIWPLLAWVAMRHYRFPIWLLVCLFLLAAMVDNRLF